MRKISLYNRIKISQKIAHSLMFLLNTKTIYSSYGSMVLLIVFLTIGTVSVLPGSYPY